MRMLVYLCVASMLFAGGLGAAFYLQQQKVLNFVAPLEDDQAAEPQQPAATRNAPRVPPSNADEIYRFLATLKSRSAQLDEREARIEREREQLKLLHEDLRIKQEELEGLHAQIRDAMTASEEKLRLLTEQRQAIEAMKAEQGADEDNGAALSPEEEASNLKMTADLLKEMEPEQAAEFIRGLAAEGQMDHVTDLMHAMGGRDGAPILSTLQLQDQALVTEIAMRLKTHKPVVSKKKTSRR